MSEPLPPEVPAPRQLPEVLRAALEADEALSLIVGAFGASLPAGDAQLGTHVNVDIGGSVIRVPALAGIAPVPAAPAYLLVTKDQVIALGTIGDVSSPGGATPVGGILPYGGSAAPAGWLLCDGATYATSLYAALFAVVGYTWGGSAGSFKVPDLVRRVPVGAGAGATPGSSEGITTPGSRGPAHHHHFTKNVTVPDHQHGGVGDHSHGSVGDHVHFASGGLAFAQSNQSTAQLGGATGSFRNLVTAFDSSTDPAGGHSHGAAGSHQHPAAGGHTVAVDGDTTGSGGADAPSYLVLNQVIRAL